MFFSLSESHARSVGKAICWRLVGSIDTFAIALLVTGSIGSAGSVAGIETITKVILYYLHERAWAGIPWGRPRDRAASAPVRVPVGN